ncbi:MAG: methionine ABC transporter ATP-binding protein [Firmicutes bacterium]|nr:methionine ABC transporter ATP-binding protein [Bacillota bacterium]
MVRLESISKVFRTGSSQIVALKNVTLHVAPGGIFGVIGLSGAGKSTLIRCINMLEIPDGGKVYVDGHEITALKNRELREARKKIGMIFQHFNLLSSRTVLENVVFPLEIAKVERHEREKRGRKLLELVGLEDKENAYPAQLSGGQKQRVGVARALANDPKVLLCDEPTSSLDPQTTRSILGLLDTINKNLGLTIILITHEMDAIRQICDEVAVIADGEIAELGRVIDIFTCPVHETTKGMVRGLNGIDAPDWAIRILEASAKAKDKKVIKLSFVGESTGQPIISSIVRDFGVDINILTAQIDHIRSVPFGVMLVELSGNNDKIMEAIDYLHDIGVSVDIIDDISGFMTKMNGGANL